VTSNIQFDSGDSHCNRNRQLIKFSGVGSIESLTSCRYDAAPSTFGVGMFERQITVVGDDISTLVMSKRLMRAQLIFEHSDSR